MLKIEKEGGLEPGPGHYKPKTELTDRLEKNQCIKIHKP
jgi:hypothetical protein